MNVSAEIYRERLGKKPKDGIPAEWKQLVAGKKSPEEVSNPLQSYWRIWQTIAQELNQVREPDSGEKFFNAERSFVVAHYLLAVKKDKDGRQTAEWMRRLSEELSFVYEEQLCQHVYRVRRFGSRTPIAYVHSVYHKNRKQKKA